MRGIWLFLLLAMVASPPLAAAQTEPVGTVSTGDDEVFRAYDNPGVYFDALSSVMVLGSVYDTVESASRTINTTPEIFVASLKGSLADDDEAGDYVFGDLEDVDVPQIGDESRATRLPLTLFGAFDGEYAVVVVRNASWVQVLIGYGIGEVDVVPDLVAIATKTLDRWPSDDPVAVREDGLRTGGIWNMVPRPEDLPAEFEVDPDFEDGPAATVDAVVPVGPREDVATPVVADEGDATVVAPSGPDRRVPLIPTVEAPGAGATEIAPIDESPATEAPVVPGDEPTPPDAGIAPIETPTATEAPATVTAPTPVATPVMNSRLAQPFDAAVEIILAEGSYERNAEDGSCGGAGLLEAVRGGGELVVREQDGETLASASISGPGVITYDTVLKQDVCYLTVQFSDVPARAGYVLVVDDAVVGRLSYDEFAGDAPALIVLGADEP